MDITKSRQLAFNENTQTAILDKLAESHDKLTRQYVATNPNTTVETLFKLGNEFPEEIIINPVFNLLFLENPQSTFIQASLLRSITTPIDVLENIVSRNLYKIEIRDIIENNISAEILDRLADINNNIEYLNLCHSILKNPRTSTQTLEKIACSRFPKHRVAEILLIKHPNVSETIIKIVEFINGSRNTPSYILEKLAHHPNDFVRQLVAQRRNTTSRIKPIF